MSGIHESDKKRGPTEDDCLRDNRSCDVISVVETDEGSDHMSMKVIISLTPQSHQDIHTKSLDINDKPRGCNIHALGSPDACRTMLVRFVAEALAGLDTEHKGSIGGK